MKNLSTKCVILGQKNLGEADKMVFIYSEEMGKLKVIAKGSRKITSKFIGHLKTLNICQALLYFGPRNIILTEISNIKSFPQIEKNLEKIQNALKIAEVTDKLLFEKQRIPNLIQMIEKTIQTLEKSDKPFLISLSYITKLLDQIGFLPDFQNIQNAGENKYFRFLEFIKTKKLEEIQNIKLSAQEEFTLKKMFKNFIGTQTEVEINFS